jgi:hypothetical protein
MSKLRPSWQQWSAWPIRIAALNLEAQQVIALRMWRLMTAGQRKAQTELERMVTEKTAALSEVQIGAAAIVLTGGNQQRLARHTLRVYRRRVRRNKRRLLKRKP